MGGTMSTMRGIEIPNGEKAVFRIGLQEVTVYCRDNELRIYADNMIYVIPWATNTIRIRVEQD